jgi:hypothetical protein
MPSTECRLRSIDLMEGVTLNFIARNHYAADPTQSNHLIASLALTAAEILRRVDYSQGINQRMDTDGEIDEWASHAAQHLPLLDLTLDELLHDEDRGEARKRTRQ